MLLIPALCGMDWIIPERISQETGMPRLTCLTGMERRSRNGSNETGMLMPITP